MKLSLRSVFFILAMIICQLWSNSLFAQLYGHEWIVSGQQYFKIPVARTGIYSLTYTQLTQAGFPANVNPATLQLWHRGVQQSIRMTGISGNTFNDILFYGQANDGTLDSLLYENPAHQPHKYYNLYSDTSYYFLTWNGTLGNRMPVTSYSAGSAEEPYHMAELLNVYTDVYERGLVYSVGTTYSFFDQGEGWTSTGISRGLNGPPAIRSYDLSVPAFFASGTPAPKLEILFTGRNRMNHVVQVLIGDDPDNPLQVFSVPVFFGATNRYFSTFLNPAHLTGGNVKVTVKVIGDGNSPDVVSVSYIKLTFPQSFTMTGGTGGSNQEKYFNLISSTDTYFSISDISGSPAIYDITNLNQPRLIGSVIEGGFLKGRVTSAAPSAKKLFITSNILAVSSVREVDLTVYPVQAEYLIVSHPKLMGKVNEYAAYRSSLPGGGYSTMVADVEKLYNIFTYGEKSPLAIRRFVKHQVDQGDPRFLLLIGKGLEIWFNHGGFYRKDPVTVFNLSGFEDLLPTAGLPGSDIMYSEGLGGKPRYIPALATGRIPARTEADVAAYLQKVRDHEELPNALWRKNMLHLSGGHTVAEAQIFKNHLLKLKIMAEGHRFGGKVKSIAKTSTGYTQIINVSEDVNKGLSYITFYGHSAPHIADIDIGFVSYPVYGYNNYKKYPMLYLNGCSSANIYSSLSFFEDWINTPNKGAILALGHSDNGYPHPLERYSKLMYQKLFTDTTTMNLTTGEVQQLVAQDFLFNLNDPISITTAQQMTLVGDPAIRMYAPGRMTHGTVLTDYATSDPELFIKSYDGNPVTAVSDSFAIGIIVSNLGITHPDSFAISVRRTIGGGATEILYTPEMYAPVLHYDTLYFKIKSKDQNTFGLNRFEIRLDHYDSIPEVDDVFNNRAVIEYFMPLTGVMCLYPKEYSVVYDQPVTFIAQSTDLLMEPRMYYMEIDTSWLFTSPFRKTNIIHSGSLIKWENVKLLDTLPLHANDSIVYYWRVRMNEIPYGQDTLWGTSSFIFIHKSPEGWSQSEFPQFLKDDVEKVIRNTVQRRWEFETVSTDIYINTTGPDFADPINTEGDPVQINQTIVKVNGLPQVFNGRGICHGSGILALTFDQITAMPYIAYPEGYVCGRNNKIINSFGDWGSNYDQLEEYIDIVPEGDYVLLLNHGVSTYSAWPASLKNKIKAHFGAAYIDSLTDGMGYILFARKGDVAPLSEQYSIDMIQLDTILKGRQNTGKITSTLIGPAYEWGTLFRTFKTDPGQSYELKLIRYTLDGTSDTLNIPQEDSLDLHNFGINADQYPFLKLHAEISDASSNPVPPQLKKWQVIYSPAPEGTMNPLAVGLEQYKVTKKHEGEKVNLTFRFDNITNINFADSVRVRFVLRNLDKGNSDTSFVNLGKLPAHGSFTFSHQISTTGFAGKNIFQAYVNPRLQREVYYHNNLIEIGLDAERDKTNPVLDVVFDGVHIMDGDIVSPSPLITVSLNDENRYLIKNDTAGIKIFFQKPGQQPEQIHFTHPDIVKWGHVQGTTNTFRAEFHPRKLPDGTYKLIVQGADASMNRAGGQFYEINFQVVNASSITNFYPYPNPFSTSTRFVFTLTGEEIPEDLKIQIMTVTGKVVREITKAELGPIHIGNNKTDYAWDGRDEFGDRLANGVYLYRVIIKNKGDNFQHRDTAGDKAFKKNFGKLYILR